MFMTRSSLQVSIKRRLKSEPASFWAGLIKKYLTNPSVTVIGVPDEEQVKKVLIVISLAVLVCSAQFPVSTRVL